MTIPVFRTASTVATPSSLPDQWAAFKNGVVDKTNDLVAYYRRAGLAVSNTNILIRLIQSSQVPVKLPLATYYRHIEQLSLDVAGTIGMTTISAYGLPNFGFFYNTDCQEEFLAYKEPLTPEVVHNNWQNVRPVRPLVIPQSDLGIMYPIGKKYSTESGITCIAVNVPMFMLQYRAWYLANELKPYAQRKTVQHFIAGCVLPNMMQDHADLLFLNRIYNAWYGFKNGDAGVFEPHPYSTTNYSSQADVMIPRILENIRKLPVKTIPTILKNIPSFSKNDMGEFLVLPGVMNVMQNDWLLVASRLRYYAMLCDMCGAECKQNNAAEFTGFIRHMRLYDAQVCMSKYLSSSHATEAKRLLEVIYRYSGRP